MLNQRDVDPVLNVMLAQNLYIYIKKKKSCQISVSQINCTFLICYKTNEILLVVLV